MGIAVIYKWVRDPQEAQVDADGNVDWSRIKSVVHHPDSVAIEFARQTAEALDTELVGISVGRADLASSLAKKSYMSRGLDRASVLADDSVETWNSTAVGIALADLAQDIGDVDLVVAGDLSADESAGIVPALMAARLGLPCFQKVRSIERVTTGWHIQQELASIRQTIEVQGPVVISVLPDALTPRVPSMKDILAAGRKPVTVSPGAEVSQPSPEIRVQSRQRPTTPKRAARMFTGNDAASELVAALQADSVI